MTTDAAVIENPAQTADTKPAPDANNVEDTKAREGTDLSAGQTDASQGDATEAKSSEATSSADDTQETPAARLKREEEEARIEARAAELAESRAADAAKAKAAEEKATKLATRKQERTNIKGGFTRALSAARIDLEGHETSDGKLPEALIRKVLGHFEGTNLKVSEFLDTADNDAANEVADEMRGIMRDLLPEAQRAGFDDAVKSDTELDFFKDAVSELKGAAAKLPLEDFLKANPAAKAQILREKNEWGDTRFEEGLNTHRGQPAGASGANGASSNGSSYGSVAELSRAYNSRQIDHATYGAEYKRLTGRDLA